MRSVLPVLAVLLAVALPLLALRGRAGRRRRAEAATAGFERFVAGLPGWQAEPDGAGWQLRRDGRLLGSLTRAEMIATAERADRRGAGPRADAWSARLRFLEAPLVPLVGPLSLKLHGPRLLPRPSHPETVAALPGSAAPALGRSADLDCPLLYVIAESDPPCYVPRDALGEVGIDLPALHGVATAVLRQRLEPEAVARALAGELVELRPADGCGAARLALVPELLAPGERLAALVADPATLLLAPPAAADRLEVRLAQARSAAREALLDRILLVGPDGVRPGPA